jgi:hypothetical protein
MPSDEYGTDVTDLPVNNKQVKIEDNVVSSSTTAVASVNEKKDSIIDKIKNLFTVENINIMIIIGVIYILLTSSVYTSNISKYLKFIEVNDNKLNTIGILFTSIVFGILYILTRNFTS